MTRPQPRYSKEEHARRGTTLYEQHVRPQVEAGNYGKVVALAGAFLLPWAAGGEGTGFELGANLLNFGALIAFMGVNAAAFMRYFVRAQEKKLMNFFPPVLGFVICAILWWNLSSKSRVFGALWMAIGIAFGAWKTRGFRGELVNFDLPAEEE